MSEDWLEGYSEGYVDAMKIVREAVVKLTTTLAKDTSTVVEFEEIQRKMEEK